MAPCGSAEMSGVVVGISQPGETVVRNVVPFLARYLASFAADAYSRIREKADFNIIVHVRMPALICTLNSFADHFVKTRRRARRSRPTICWRPIIPFFPPCRDYARIFRRSARRGVAVPDADLLADRPAARFARANQEKPGHAAIGPG